MSCGAAQQQPQHSTAPSPAEASRLPLLPTGVLAAAGVSGGLTMQLALVCDLLHILALPVLFAYVVYTKLYALQLHYTLLMWRLMRGNR